MFRIVLRHHGNGVCAVETGAGCLHCGKQIAAVAVVFVAHAVGNDFRVGLRFEFVAQPNQTGAFGFEVFDNAVVHHGDFAAGNMRVRVRLGHAAVGGPARVPDAQLPEHAFFLGGGFHIGHAPDTAHAFYLAFGQYGNAR